MSEQKPSEAEWDAMADEAWREADALQAQVDRRLICRFIVEATLRPDKITSSDRCLRWWSRLGYLVKGWVCLVMGWRPDYRKTADYPDVVKLAGEQWDTYGGYEYDELVIGCGCRSGWWYDIVHNGEWFM